MNDFLETLGWTTGPLHGPIAAVLIGGLTGVLAVAFTLGGLWALRGRPRLAVPSCRRCASRLRGAGLAIPLACPECGRSLEERRAVRWVQFRRQPFTLLITAPVVLFGGTLLAYVCVGMAASAVSAIIDGWAFEKKLATWQREPESFESPDAVVAAPPPPAPVVVQPFMELIARAEAKDDSRMEALVEVLTRLRSDTSIEADSEEAARLRAIAEELVSRDAEWWRQRHAPKTEQLAVDVVASLLQVIQTNELASNEWITARIAAAMPTGRCEVPAQVRPGSPVGIRFTFEDGPISAWIFAQPDVIELDGVEVFRRAPTAGGSIPAVIDAPKELGAHDLKVSWALIPSIWRAHTPRDGGAMQRVSTVTFHVRDEPERIPTTTDPALDPMSSPRFAITMGRTDVGARDMLFFRVQNRSSVALRGSWSVLVDGTWEPLGDGGNDEIMPEWALVRRPSAGWPTRVRVRFEPAPESECVLMKAPSAGPRRNAYFLQMIRSSPLAWGEAREFELESASNAAGSAEYYKWPPP